MATLAQTEPPHALGVPRSQAAGLLLLAGSPPKPLYANTEAVEILAYPQRPEDVAGLDLFLERKIRAILGDHWSGHRPCSMADFVSGKRHYLCRAFSLNSSAQPRESHQPAVAVLLERSGAALDSSHLVEQFRLT